MPLRGGRLPIGRRGRLGGAFVGRPLFGGPLFRRTLLRGRLGGCTLLGRSLLRGLLFGCTLLGQTLLRRTVFRRALLGRGPLLRRPEDALLGSRLGLRWPAMRAAE